MRALLSLSFFLTFLVRPLSAHSVQVQRVPVAPDYTHTHTHTHSIGLLCTRYRPVIDTSTCQHTTLTRHSLPCSWRDLNPQSQQARASDPRLRQHGHWDRRQVLLMWPVDAILYIKYSTEWLQVGFLRIVMNIVVRSSELRLVVVLDMPKRMPG